jgi:hypothetical protein
MSFAHINYKSGFCGLHLLDISLTIALMMEAATTSETSVNFYQTTRRNNTEDCHLHTRRRENLKSRMETVCSSETSVSTYKSTRRYNPEDKHRFPRMLLSDMKFKSNYFNCIV